MGRIQMQLSGPADGLLFVTKDIAVTSRTWVCNEVGTATVVVPYSHPRFREVVTYGNIIRLREYGLPTWVGVAVQRDWNHEAGVCALQCKSAEWLLQKKLTGQGRVYGAKNGISAGNVAYDLYHNALVQNSDNTPILPGKFSVGNHVFREYNYADLYEALKKLAADTQSDFWVDEQLRLHFVSRRGVDRRNSVVLREGRHLSGVKLMDSVEELTTALIGLGEGSKLIDKQKVLLKLRGTPFFRADTYEVDGAGSYASVEGPTKEKLLKEGQPRLVVDANVEDVVDSMFPNGAHRAFVVGDTVRLIVDNPLYRNVVAKVIGMERGENESIRAMFEIIPTLTYANIVPWAIQ